MRDFMHANILITQTHESFVAGLHCLISMRKRLAPIIKVGLWALTIRTWPCPIEALPLITKWTLYRIEVQTSEIGVD